MKIDSVIIARERLDIETRMKNMRDPAFWQQHVHAKRCGPLETKLINTLVNFGIVLPGSPRPQGMRKRKDTPPGRCFYNAFVQATHDGPLYVEGYAWAGDGDAPMGHGWCMDDDRRIIDRSLRHPEKAVYLGIPLDYRKVCEIVRNHFNNRTGWVLGHLIQRKEPLNLKELVHPAYRGLVAGAVAVDQVS